MDDMTLEEYRALVQKVMQDALIGGAPLLRVFENSGDDHAAVVLNTMVDHAQGDLSLYANEMCNRVWDPGRVRSFLTRSPEATVRILVDSPAAVDSPTSALSGLRDLIGAGRIHVRRRTSDKKALPHVALADGRHVRVEKDPKGRKAVVAFGNPDLGRKVTLLFDNLWAEGTTMLSAVRA